MLTTYFHRDRSCKGGSILILILAQLSGRQGMSQARPYQHHRWHWWRQIHPEVPTVEEPVGRLGPPCPFLPIRPQVLRAIRGPVPQEKAEPRLSSDVSLLVQESGPCCYSRFAAGLLPIVPAASGRRSWLRLQGSGPVSLTGRSLFDLSVEPWAPLPSQPPRDAAFSLSLVRNGASVSAT